MQEVEKTHIWQDVSLSLRLQKNEKNEHGFVWLGGLRSDMSGTKASVMVEQAKKLGVSSLRFDYSGHGQSQGKFENYCLSDWLEQSVLLFQTYTSGKQILVGSSMGGWLALRLLQTLKEIGEADRVGGVLLLAPAPDFTSELMEKNFTNEQIKEIKTNGFIKQKSEYSDEPLIITNKLIEDGKKHLVLGGGLCVGVPIHILHGMQDIDVPYSHALKLVDCLLHENVVLSLIKGGDHRLSNESDLSLLRRVMQEMSISIFK